MALDKGEESGNEERIRNGLRRVVSPDTSSGFKVAFGDLLLLLLPAFLGRHTGLSQLGFEIARVGLLGGLLLLLLQRGGVELAVCCGCGFLAFLAFCILGGLLRLLLLGQALEHFGHFVDILVGCVYNFSSLVVRNVDPSSTAQKVSGVAYR